MKKDIFALKISLFYLLISLTFTFYLLGFNNLSSNSLDWLISGDRIGELIGWLNFKNSNWTFPFGNYSQGEIGVNSVVFNGTVPLLAILFKLFFKNSDTFQYFSFWILMCVFLQGFISFIIINKLTKNILYSIIGSFFFLISPIFIHRVGIHISLAGHWIILIYFLNYLFYNKNFHRNNIIIIILSAGIHFYFTAILIITDFILYFYWYFLKKKKFFFIKNIFLKIFCLFIFMYCLGYFAFPAQNVLGGGFGKFKMNLLSFIDPGVSSMGQKVVWSSFIPDIPNNYGEHEGFSYFGIGFILMLIISTYHFFRKFNEYELKKKKIYFYLFIILTLISLSNNVGLADKNIITVSLNNLILAPLSIIRASGRFFWIVNYFLLLFSLFIIFKNYPKNKNILISIIFLIQFIDISAGLKEYSNGKYFNNNNKIFFNKNWDLIEKNFEIVSSTYLKNPSPEFYALSGLLVNSNLKSELIVSARYDRKKFINLRYKNYNKLYNGILEKKIFIISGKSHLNFLNKIYENNNNIRFDKINDNWILYNIGESKIFDKTVLRKRNIQSKKIKLDTEYEINFLKSFDKVSFLGLGWTSYKDTTKPWTDGDHSSLIFDLSNLKEMEDYYYLDIDFKNKFLKDDEYILLEVLSNGYHESQNYRFVSGEGKSKKISIKINKSLIDDDILILNFKTKGVLKTDFENLIGIDERKVGLMIDRIKLRK
jgi:hypothetical protein